MNRNKQRYVQVEGENTWNVVRRHGPLHAKAIVSVSPNKTRIVVAKLVLPWEHTLWWERRSAMPSSHHWEVMHRDRGSKWKQEKLQAFVHNQQEIESRMLQNHLCLVDQDKRRKPKVEVYGIGFKQPEQQPFHYAVEVKNVGDWKKELRRITNCDCLNFQQMIHPDFVMLRRDESVKGLMRYPQPIPVKMRPIQIDMESIAKLSIRGFGITNLWLEHTTFLRTAMDLAHVDVPLGLRGPGKHTYWNAARRDYKAVAGEHVACTDIFGDGFERPMKFSERPKFHVYPSTSKEALLVQVARMLDRSLTAFEEIELTNLIEHIATQEIQRSSFLEVPGVSEFAGTREWVEKKFRALRQIYWDWSYPRANVTHA